MLIDKLRKNCKIYGPYKSTGKIDRNFENNSLENLQILSRTEHTSIDRLRIQKITVNCLNCNKVLIRDFGDEKHNKKKGKAGPFCRSCAGKYGTDLQNGKRNKLNANERIVPEPVYYKLKK